MIIPDTDHVNEIQNAQGVAYQTLSANMAISPDQAFVTTVITLEEQMRGWLALVNRLRDPRKQLTAYARWDDMVESFSRWVRLPFDDRAAQQFEELRSQRVRIGTMDLKIASIALVHNSLLLSPNLVDFVDFQRVPGLQVADWLRSRAGGVLGP